MTAERTSERVPFGIYTPIIVIYNFSVLALTVLCRIIADI